MWCSPRAISRPARRGPATRRRPMTARCSFRTRGDGRTSTALRAGCTGAPHRLRPHHGGRGADARGARPSRADLERVAPWPGAPMSTRMWRASSVAWSRSLIQHRHATRYRRSASSARRSGRLPRAGVPWQRVMDCRTAPALAGGLGRAGRRKPARAVPAPTGAPGGDIHRHPDGANASPDALRGARPIRATHGHRRPHRQPGPRCPAALLATLRRRHSGPCALSLESGAGGETVQARARTSPGSPFHHSRGCGRRAASVRTHWGWALRPAAPRCCSIATDTPSTWLHALGPLSRPAFWEVTAVPEISVQVHQLVEELARPASRRQRPRCASDRRIRRSRRGNFEAAPATLRGSRRGRDWAPVPMWMILSF